MPVALVTNQGIGLQISKDLAARGFTVLAGSRNLERGEAAVRTIDGDARAIRLDVTDQASIAAAALLLKPREVRSIGEEVLAGAVQVNERILGRVQAVDTVEEGAREAVRVALLGPNAPTGTSRTQSSERCHGERHRAHQSHCKSPTRGAP